MRLNIISFKLAQLVRYIGNFKFYLYFNSESKLNTLVQKLHDFLAHSSEESEDANSPPALSKNKTIGKKTFCGFFFQCIYGSKVK